MALQAEVAIMMFITCAPETSSAVELKGLFHFDWSDTIEILEGF